MKSAVSYSERVKRAAALTVFLWSCASSGPQASSGKQKAAPSSKAKLVVSVVLDQLGSSTLQDLLPFLDEEGAIRQSLRKGAYYPTVRYAYASTLTSAGHASIYTGAPPVISGIPANSRWTEQRGKVPLIDDGHHAVFGRSGAYAAPTVLQVATVADALDEATEGRAKIVSLSLKDRGAVLPGGRHADAVFWYEHKAQSFTSSNFYMEALPQWFVDWKKAHPVNNYMKRWTPLEGSAWAKVLGPDAREDEVDWHGLGKAFAHDPKESKKSHSVFRATPGSTEYLLDLAKETVRQYELGADETPDLLAISISATDYVGHVFGPYSWEYFDHFVRVDRMLGRFLKALSESTQIAVLITSDHGVLAMPNPKRAEPVVKARIVPTELVERLNKELAAAGFSGAPVAAFEKPFVYLRPKERDGPDGARLIEAAVAQLKSWKLVELAADVREIQTWRGTQDPLKRAIALSVPEGVGGQIYVVPKEGVLFDPEMEGSGGTSHGTPWDYDRQVPVLFWGPGVKPAVYKEVVEQGRVASTISALLSSPPPEQAVLPALNPLGM